MFRSCYWEGKNEFQATCSFACIQRNASSVFYHFCLRFCHFEIGRLLRCVRCPTAYHVGDFCIAAGSINLTGFNIVCAKHFQPVTSQKHHSHVNVSWCFDCNKGELFRGLNTLYQMTKFLTCPI